MRPWVKRKRLGSWSSDIVSNAPRGASTLAKQTTLPRLPVPELGDTVQRYLNTLEPFYHILASRGGPSIEASRTRQQSLAKDFLRAGGIGDTLQQRVKGAHLFWHSR